MARTLEEIIEDRRRNMRALYIALNGDPLAAEVAAKCGVRADNEPPPEQEVQQSTRAIAASLMQGSTAVPTPEPIAPEPPDALAAAVTARLRRHENTGASNLGLLPNQSKE